MIVGHLPGLVVVRAVGEIGLQRGPHHQRARRLVERFDRHQRAAHVGMHDDRVGRLVLALGARDRTALQPLLGVGSGILVGDLGLRQALHADGEPRLVHHREHRVQAAVFLTQQPAGGAVVVHHAGGVAVDAHLLFERAAGDRVARADRAVGVRQHLGHDEQRNSLGALGRAFDAREHEVDDVGGEVVLAGGNEDLGAGDLVAAVGLLRRLAAQQPQVRAAMRLGQVHGAGPLAGDHLRQIARLQLGRAVRDQRRDRALRQPRIHGEGQVRRGQEFVDDLGEDHRQALAAELGRRRDADPATLDQLLERVAKTLRRGHPAVGVTRAAFLVARAIERGEHLFAELGGLGEDRRDDVGGGVGKAGKIRIAFDVEYIAQQELHVVNRCLVGRHGASPIAEWEQGCTAAFSSR